MRSRKSRYPMVLRKEMFKECIRYSWRGWYRAIRRRSPSTLYSECSAGRRSCRVQFVGEELGGRVYGTLQVFRSTVTNKFIFKTGDVRGSTRETRLAGATVNE